MCRCLFLLQSGALWHLLVFLFNYDYTLDEGGVEVSAETNQQVLRENKQQQQDSQHGPIFQMHFILDGC